MPDDTPLVSVVIPTYNRASVLPRAVDSALDQTYDNVEIIIVDDGSTDNTSDVIAAYDQERLTAISLESNRGAPHARNVGIERADGEYISFLDSDDEYEPTRIATLVSVLRSAPDNCAGVFHSYVVRTENGVRRTSRAPNHLIGAEEIRDENIIGGLSCTMFKRDVLVDVGLFDESLPSAQDYDLYLRVLDDRTMRGVDEFLSVYHVTEGSISNDPRRMIAGQKELERKHDDRLSANLRSRQRYSRFFLYANEGEFAKARAELREAIRTYPRNPLYYYHYLFSLAGKPGVRASLTLKEAVKDVLYRLR